MNDRVRAEAFQSERSHCGDEKAEDEKAAEKKPVGHSLLDSRKQKASQPGTQKQTKKNDGEAIDGMAQKSAEPGHLRNLQKEKSKAYQGEVSEKGEIVSMEVNLPVSVEQGDQDAERDRRQREGKQEKENVYCIRR